MTTNLLSRLQGLTAPDREVDALIMARCFPEWAEIGEPYLSPQCIGDEPIYWHAPEPYYKRPVPELTASLDAAVALCERVLPGWKKHMWDAGVFGSILPTAAVLQPDFVRKSIKGEPYIKVDGEGPTPAIALLIAILTALEDREK